MQPLLSNGVEAGGSNIAQLRAQSIVTYIFNSKIT